MLHPLLYYAPARETAGQKGVDDEHEKPARLVLSVKLFLEGRKSLTWRFHRHHVTDLLVVRERRPVICSPMHQNMEMRTPAVAPSTRVLLADQWAETGGTMQSAIGLVERQKGVVASLVAIAIEENEQTTAYRAIYPCVSAVVPGSRWQTECNAQTLSSFERYDPTAVFPRLRSTR